MNCVFCLCLKCPKDLVRPMSLVLDDRGSQPRARSASLRVSTKTKAPSPPGLKTVDCPGFSQWRPGNPHLTMDQKENMMDKELSLTVVLPDGLEKKTQVEGSKALMDLLVTLCATYHLNPSSHTLELVTANRNSVKLKPNASIGSLGAEKIILKPKGDDKNKKAGPPMPEATVRMVINFKKSQKTVLRVNPRVPLRDLLPAICEKCEFTTETTILLRDVTSSTPLDLSGSLNDHEIREVYAKDTKGQLASSISSSSPVSTGAVISGEEKNQKEKENKGLFSKFRKSRKKSEPTTASAPASPVLVSKPRPLSMALPCSNSSPVGSPTFSNLSKKRRAPQPPVLMSQSIQSDFTAHQRINSESNTQLDGIQSSPVSLGSSAESSLKRTKRKAPPPPTSPSPVVQKTQSEEEHLQETSASTKLQEIMEQEEAAGSVISSASTNTQGQNSSLSVSPESSIHSPSPDAVSGSTLEAGGEDQCLDLSSDGKVDSFINDCTAEGIKKIDGSNPFEPIITESTAVQADEVYPQPVPEETKVNSSERGPLPPVKKDAEVQASSDELAEPPRELPDGSASSVTTNEPRPAGEESLLQTDSLGPSVPAQQHVDKVSLSADLVALGSTEKKDMATSTDELQPPKPELASVNTSSPSPSQDSKPSTVAAKKAPSMHVADPELKPKPSNELTRDYIPKVGMTTYTIVPQKSLEKLRYFEVALTLEAPPEAPGEEVTSGSPGLKEDQGQMEVLKEKTELNCNLPRDDSLSSTVNTNTTTLSTTTMQHTVNGGIPKPPPLPPPMTAQSADKISSSANDVLQAGSPADVKEIKIPPATRPKPASFRLGQHKKTPGYYVTSAAEKSLSASPVSGPKETQGCPDRTALLSPPPPPLSPTQLQEETIEVAGVQLSPKQDSKNLTPMQITRQSSLPCREPGSRLSLEKFRSFAAPRPFSPSPSRFAQAVSSAVKRSQSLSHRSKSPPSSVPSPVSPVTNPSSVIQSKDLSEQKYAEEDTEKAKETGL
ncbi:cordon-bleu protein-like 1b isoform X2 [Cyprinodon tularosa]|uniref:cordon-bleu protein-like 1b isoform X2 n=1 Tax=Cyprinodon tularosa TaxID=77115 RepID=UPI0018E26E4D|nr:cordon-bleu protein-like 1b isoform X2 [Cyprinodon tularosa]